MSLKNIITTGYFINRVYEGEKTDVYHFKDYKTDELITVGTQKQFEANEKQLYKIVFSLKGMVKYLNKSNTRIVQNNIHVNYIYEVDPRENEIQEDNKLNSEKGEIIND